MIPFLTYREKNKLGVSENYILQRIFPYYCGRIVSIPVLNALINEPISGYNLFITFSGTISGNLLPLYTDSNEEMKTVFFNMANWFKVERIEVEPKRYEKFKIKTDDSTNK